MTDWFRSWHGAPTDPKWLGIAKRAAVAPGIAVAVGWALMDRASAAEDRGNVEGYDADGLGCFFGCEAEQVDAIVAAMVDKGMISAGRFTNWERRQPRREDDSSQRVREHRQRTKDEAKRAVTQRNAPEAEQKVDTEDRPLAQQPLASRGRAELDRLDTALRRAAGAESDPAPGLLSLAPILGLLDAGHDLEADILPTIRALAKRAKRRPVTWDYYTEAIREASAKRRGVGASGLSPPVAAAGGNIFDQAAQVLRNGSVRDSGGDGATFDAVPRLSDQRGFDQRDDAEGVSDRDRRLHAGGTH